MGCLNDGIGVVDHGAWLPQSETQLTKEALALADPEVHLELLFEEGGEGLPVPEGAGEPGLVRSATQGGLHGPHLDLGEPARSAGAIAFGQT